jgi:predicted O-methyltransferase YrrM
MTDFAAPAAGARPLDRATPAVFAAVTFASAALVFLVEPMMARLILPRLGGSPAVWNTSLAFFQAALLVGYAYAHGLQRVGSVRTQTLIHGGVLIAAALVLPLRVSAAVGDPRPDQPILWLLAVLALSVGPPFAALSATAPLIQAWYARVRAGHPRGANPYPLYAASNLGSLLALLAYPTLVEPMLSLHDQTLDWSLGYGAFVLAIGALAAIAWRVAYPSPPEGEGGSRRLSDEGSRRPIRLPSDTPIPAAGKTPHPTPFGRHLLPQGEKGTVWRDRFLWVALAAAPSSLMLGVTTYISTDIASAPFLWVAPLALYLLTFVIAFQQKPLIPRGLARPLQALAFVACLCTLAAPVQWFLPQIVLHLVGFFLTALVCHQALVARRPPPERLTEFYLLMSLGGVIGGGFNAFLAPVIFSGVFEYPLMLLAAGLARPWGRPRVTRREAIVAGVGLAGALACLALSHAYGPQPGFKLLLALPILAALWMRDRAPAFVVLGLVLALAAHAFSPREDLISAERSFFGVLRLTRIKVPGLGETWLLAHGTTLHGAQARDPAQHCRPLVYYAPTTPIGQVFGAVEAREQGSRIGVIGMGAGTVASYVRQEDSLRFFEIDPQVVAMATNPKAFSYIHGCADGPVDWVLGDARLTLAREPAGEFDLLLVDAFSSDSVPAHLLTVEAMRSYLAHIKPDGVVVMHLTNRNLELMSPVAAIAKAAGGYALQQSYQPPKGFTPMVDTHEDAILIARSPAALVPYQVGARWAPAQDHGVRVWTDDYSNLFGALVRKTH